MRDNRARAAALVTGGAVRLGKAFALHLAEKGFDIALHYNSNVASAHATRDEIRRFGVDCALFQADFTQPAETSNFLERVLGEIPHLELLLNSASVYHAGGALQLSQKQLDENFAVNFFAPYALCRDFGANVEKGQIINILDNKIFFQQWEYSGYILSKRCLAEFTYLAAVELAPRIRVNGIAPGVILPAADRPPAYLEWRRAGIPVDVQGEVRHLLQALDYILANDFITGQILRVDGGESVAQTGRNFLAYRPGQELNDSAASSLSDLYESEQG